VLAFGFDHPERPEGPAFEGGVYDRVTGVFEVGKLRYTATTVYGLPEFDQLGYQTVLAARLVAELGLRPQRAVVFNPGQGHLPVLLALCGATVFGLVDRDLLALRATRRNLLALDPGIAVSTTHAAVPEPVGSEPVDLGVLVLREKEPAAAHAAQLAAVAGSVRSGGLLLVVGRATAVERVLRSSSRRDVRRPGRHQRHGYAATAMTIDTR
jgi:hypothetical protein